MFERLSNKSVIDFAHLDCRHARGRIESDSIRFLSFYVSDILFLPVGISRLRRGECALQ